jgi:solute carrier family 34 (sodium-dependent phosphate cotransporter)
LAPKIQHVAGSIISLYFFVSAIVLIKSSAARLGEFLAESIVLVIQDTTSGVSAGWIGTALLHSSGAFDSIILAFVSTGVMPLSLAVATVIGAEIGTTVTPFLISVLNQIRGKERQSATFNVTITHVLYNLATLAIFYPFEMFFGVLTKVANVGSMFFVDAPWLSAMPNTLEVATPWVPLLLSFIPAWGGLLIGALTLVLALAGVERYMTEIFNMPRSWNLIRSTFTKPLRAFLAGFLFTLLIPSTTVMVSLLIPLAASGVLSTEFYILPYILGSNIGTCFSVLLAAIATGNPIAMGVWLVQLTINVVGAVIFMILMKPFSRIVRLTAERVAASPRLTLIIAAVFHLIPTSVIVYYLLR